MGGTRIIIVITKLPLRPSSRVHKLPAYKRRLKGNGVAGVAGEDGVDVDVPVDGAQMLRRLARQAGHGLVGQLLLEREAYCYKIGVLFF